jgi:tetratricopeptide (TPR) repeat protein
MAVCCSLLVLAGPALAQGDDIGAGVFKPKNPETKRRGPRPVKPVVKNTRKPDTALDDRIDDLLEKGNNARDAKRFAEAQEAYEGVLKLRAHDSRGAYGLGNVYTDQRRWDDAEKAYRDTVEWAPKDVDALVALSVVLVQPVDGANNAKRFADAQGFAQRAVQLDPKNAVAWDRLGVAMQSRGTFNAETENAYRRAVELDPQFAVAPGKKLTGVCPSLRGLKGFGPAAYSPAQSLFFVPANNLCMDFEPVPAGFTAGKPFLGATVKVTS